MSRGFPEEFKQELLSKTDIVDVVSRYVDLKKKGGKYWGCCPFHHEKTASFNVDINKQFFYCFGCHKGGDAISFMMSMENLGYVEAVEYLADKAGLAVPKGNNFKADDERERRRKRHYEINKAAANFYYSNLISKDKKAAIYCNSRGISPVVAKRFGIGYATSGRNDLLNHLIEKGYSTEEIISSGLVKKSETGKLYDFFFDRLMFPIMDIYGNVIAFGGRVLGDGKPKYLNSSDSPLYNKKKHLYGLNIAKKSKQTDTLILVEGYMDVVTVSSFGIGGAIASLGTALTREQCLLIKRFTRDVYIAYDGDDAGQKAAVRASKLLMAEGIIPKILVFEGGMDPDEFLKKYGADEFDKLMGKAVLPYLFEVDWLARGYDLSTDIGKREFATVGLGVASGVKNAIDKDDIIRYLALKTGYSNEVLYQQVDTLNKPDVNSHNSTQMPVLPHKVNRRTEAEATALKLALNGKRKEILDGLSEDDFQEPVFKECFLAIKDGMDDEESARARFYDEGKQSLITMIVAISDDIVRKASADECISALKRESIKTELEKCSNMLKQTGLDKEERNKIFIKITELQKRLKHN